MTLEPAASWGPSAWYWFKLFQRCSVLGKLSGVMSDAIAFCFDAISQGTALEGASLEIHEIEGCARCKSCGAEFKTATLFTPCPYGSRQLVWLQGEELKIKSIELMEAA